jgi:GH25 family lysozyme M1 (1,4-beta-N-acetylmuramidase)
VLVAAAVLLAAVTPAGALLTGIDVASHQHPNGAPINWGQVRAAGHSYAFVKATEGTTYTNPWFRQDFDAAGAAGLYRGAYHYARPGLPLSTATAQARYMVSVTGTLGGGADLPLVLDLEETGGLGPTDLAAWARTFLGELERLTGRPPIIYVGYYFWRDAVGAPSDLASRYRLWLPSYPADPNSTTFRPLVPAGWSTWTFWQYTSTGSVPGIVGNVDINRFCCDAGTLAGLAGSGRGAGNPFGNLDIVNRLPGSAQIEGWAIDPDTRLPVNAHLYVDGRWAGQVLADAPRADVGAAYPGYGPLHGLSTRIPIGSGSREVCAYAINTGPGSTNPLLGCRPLVADPLGNLDGLRIEADGDVVATGWALDADASVPIGVHFYVNGRWGGAVTTDVARPDVQAAYPGAGNTQGFQTTFRGLVGRNTVCAFGINIGSGTTNPLLGCATVDVPTGDPVGALTSVVAGVGSARVAGWAADPDSAGPIDVHLYVDGAWGGSHRAELSSPDSVLAIGGPAAAAFDVSLALSSGRHTVCAYGINVGRGTTNPLLGCRAFDIGSTPIGTLDAMVRSGNTVSLAGWAIDPDVAGPVGVHVYVDGAWGGLTTASLFRPDVGAAFPRYGPDHGFSMEIGVPSGPRQVCVYLINQGPGTTNPLLECRRV